MTKEELKTKEQEDFDRLMADLDASADVVLSQNARIIRAIASVNGQQFVKDLKAIDNEWNFGGGFFPYKDEIVRKPYGKYQKHKDEDTGKPLKTIKGFWVDEYENGGMEGDSWSGYVYIELKKGRYLKTHYSL